MKAEISGMNGVKIVRLSGEVRISTQNEFKDLLDLIVRENRAQTVIMNMCGIPFINSVGLGIIIDTFKKFKEMNGRLILCGLLPEIWSLFEVTGLDRFIDIFRNETEAFHGINGLSA